MARKEGLEQGRNQGLKEGIRKNSNDIVINIYKNSVSLEDMSKYTLLNVEQIKNIIWTSDNQIFE